VAGYRVYFGSSSRTYFQPLGTGLSAGTATTFTVAGLQRGQTYYFAVTDVDSLGNESPYSNEATKFIP
jgi:hypothetical protein